MKKLVAGILLAFLIGCDNGKEVKNVSTVDSNTAIPADSNDALLYLDNPQSDSFTIAVDSSVRGKSNDTSND
ncbi:MAG TPA: hypothetical protein VM888_07685 [Chitinophagaceae bacterium]|jgi:hypothetical protein|nr:hypothetical protein [Chitinophagaceae bacterium]